MKLIGQQALRDFTRKHADARGWIEAWARTVEEATWRDIEKLRRAYPHADGVKLKSGRVVTVFNCKGNVYRLLCYVTFVVQTVQVLEMLTHAEYSKDSWKERY